MDLLEEQDNKQCKVMVYDVFERCRRKHMDGAKKYILGAGVEGPFWNFFDRMAKLKDMHRKDPIVCSGAAELQQEVVRSMCVLQSQHHPADCPLEIQLFIFDYAKLEVTYFNKVTTVLP